MKCSNSINFCIFFKCTFVCFKSMHISVYKLTKRIKEAQNVNIVEFSYVFPVIVISYNALHSLHGFGYVFKQNNDTRHSSKLKIAVLYCIRTFEFYNRKTNGIRISIINGIYFPSIKVIIRMYNRIFSRIFIIGNCVND